MSEGAVLKFNIEYQLISCCVCGLEFAVPSALRSEWVDSGEDFYCPNGHILSYEGTRQREIERLKERIEAERNTNNFLRKQNEKERNRTRAEKAAKTRIKNRIKNGVCPCCNRHFKNLHQHMQNQHPDYVKDKKK